ncbi:MAG TPA: competence/damage-inducible protein A [Ilumatobacteraceae bacterium]|nr:competence/damage-inducible protein A [Ilumatobacteraceae bacterium]HRB03391.1 competence/damage-inducible protein A [Ilumatobacteraceae bacterium]
MRCDVVAIGTELLLGQITDTNSQWIGEQLAAVGVDSLLQVKVGDNLGRMESVLRSVLAAADAVIVCGGLGPTHDDVTREAIASVMGVELLANAEVGAVIREMFEARGRRMAENNLRQAMVPQGATIIAQTRGTAPGLICPVVIEGVHKVIYAVPGVPHEMMDMVQRAVLPDLLARGGEDAAVILSRTLRTWGESESGLNERLDPLIARLDEVGNPTLAFNASGWEGIKIRLTAKAATQAEALRLLGTWEAETRALVDDVIFGVDDETMESVVLQLLRERGWSLGLAESVTGGLVAGRITNVPGASEVFRGSIVSYASDVKFDVLGVPRGPVVSEAAAAAMARGAQRVLNSHVALALTGVAGPAAQDGMPVGTLCVGIAIGDDVHTRTLRMPGARDQMRQMSVISAMDLLRRVLLAS